MVAAVGLGVAAAGHAYAGGGITVGPVGVLAGLLVTAAAVLVSRTQWTTSRLLVALLGMQVVAHGALWLEGGGHAAHARLAALADAAPAHAHAGAGDATDLRMLLAHVAAVAVAAVLLAGLDAAVVLLAALARRLRPVVLAAAPTLPPRRAGRAAPGLAAWALERSTVVRRGPPALLAPC